MSSIGYYSKPALSGDQLIFISDDDLWSCSRNGGIASRLTTSSGRILTARFSPGGKEIAYLANESGLFDLYVMPSEGGEARRISFCGLVHLLGYYDKKHILVVSSHKAPNRGMGQIYKVHCESGDMEVLPFGPSNRVAFQSDGKGVLLGRNCMDSARWKRYQGGTAGKFFLDVRGKGQFSPYLEDIRYNLTDPYWIGDSIYFVSDHEGCANVYTLKAGESSNGLKRLTHHSEYYVRNLNYDADAGCFVYQAGAQIFLLDLKETMPQLVNIKTNSSASQAKERFESLAKKIDDYDVSDDAKRIALISRGRLYTMHPWRHAPQVIGCREESRYHRPTYLPGSNQFAVACTNHDGEELLKLFDEEGEFQVLAKSVEWGKIWTITPSPDGKWLAVANNKNELWLVSTAPKKRPILIEKNDFSRIQGISFAPDASCLSYTQYFDGGYRSRINCYDLAKKEIYPLTDPVSRDWGSSFSPCGKYLYFLSVREFHPNYNQTHFDLGFPFAGRPFVLVLDSSTESPFESHLENQAPKKDGKGKKKKKLKMNIERDGLFHRVLPFPLELGGYYSLQALEGKVLIYRKAVKPIKPGMKARSDSSSPQLLEFKFDSHKKDVFHKDVSGFALSNDRKWLLLKSKGKLRLVGTKDAPKSGTEQNKTDGWIDLSRVQLKLNPRAEWRQMYREAWLLQKEHFWTEDLSQVDWDMVYQRYLPVLERATTRHEISDLMWEMQGELGTSHCYEVMGDYPKKPSHHPIGRLGARMKFKKASKSYEIVSFVRGDSWLSGHDSPLLAPGVGLKEGDQIFAVDGVDFEHSLDLYRELEGKASKYVDLLILRSGKRKKEKVSVKTASSMAQGLYRQWVNTNRKLVDELSGGKLGYVHIPDMGTRGYSEFFRTYTTQLHKEGMIVDVRYNGGGHVSQHIIKHLKQEVVAFHLSRWHGISPYPGLAVNGPIVAVTNEHAGSDGDIFSHSFKLLNVGTLVGKRTWGGVIGINSQYRLKDGTLTTQPEYSYWFKDVGFGVENYGTDPHVEVDILPQDWVAGKDPQLEKAVEIAMEQTKEKGSLQPDFSSRPSLAIPKLPNIPQAEKQGFNKSKTQKKNSK